MKDLHASIALAESAHATIEFCGDDYASVFDLVYKQASAVWPLFGENFEVWTDPCEEKFASSPWDEIARSPAEYALMQASICAECNEFEMAADERTVTILQDLLALARNAGVTDAMIAERMPFLTRHNDELAALLS